MGTLLRSLRWPRLLVAVTTAAVVLGIAAATGPLFLASAANALLADELALVGENDAGLAARLFGRIDRDRFDNVQDKIYDTITPIEHLGEPTATAIGAALTVSDARREGEARMRLLYRDGALDNVERLRGDPDSPGVWMSDGVADALGVDVGDEIVLSYASAGKRARIAGIYRTLWVPLNEYWRPLMFEIVNLRDNDFAPPPFLIADKRLFFELQEIADQAELSWHFPLTDRSIDYDEAVALEHRYDAAHHAPDDPLSPLGRATREIQVFSFQTLSIDSLLFSVMDNIRATVTSLDTSMRVVTLAGQAVALFAIAGAAAFIARGRRTEIKLLLAQGISPLGIGGRVAAEMILPVVGGMALGWVAARGLVTWLGPSERLTSSASTDALRTAGVAAVLSVIVLGIVVAAQARREVEIGFARVRRVLGRMPWEVVVLALAAAAYYEMSSGRSSLVASPGEAPEIDIFVLAFPLLFISGVAGLGVRVLKHLLPRLRTSGATLPVPLYLAWRRLADASSIALLLISLTAVATGVLIYAAALVDSVEATVRAKALVATGSDVSVDVTQQTQEPDAPFPTTRVTRERGEIFPGDIEVDIIGIDPATFASTAYWDDSFSDTSLGALIELLARPGERLPVVASGFEASGRLSLAVSSAEIPIEIVDNPVAFPGMRFNAPAIAVDQETFAAAAEAHGVSAEMLSVVLSTEIWGRGDPAEVSAYFEDQGLFFGASRDSRDFLDAGPLRSIGWTFSLMQALGVLAATIVLVALLFYLQTRQRERDAAYGLSKRMGLAGGSHRASLAVELFAMLVVAALLGEVAAVLGAKLVLANADPLPEVPPPGLFRVPIAIVLGLIPAILGIAGIGAWRVQRAADGARMAEVMRVAG